MTVEAAGPPFGAGGWDADLLAELADVPSRSRPASGRRSCRGRARGRATLGIFGSGTPEQASLQGFSGSAFTAADRIPGGRGPLSGEALQVRFEGLRGLVGDRRVAASTNWTSERTAASMAADVDALAAAGRRRARPLQPHAHSRGGSSGDPHGCSGVPPTIERAGVIVDGHVTSARTATSTCRRRTCSPRWTGEESTSPSLTGASGAPNSAAQSRGKRTRHDRRR